MLLLKREPRLDPRHAAFLYQVQAVEAVRQLEYAALFHEQGLGKTKIGIDLALSWLKEHVAEFCPDCHQAHPHQELDR